MKKYFEKINSNVYLGSLIALHELYTMIVQILKSDTFLLFVKQYDWARFISIIILCILVIRVSMQMVRFAEKAKLMQLCNQVRLWQTFAPEIDYGSDKAKMKDVQQFLETEKAIVKRIWHSTHNHVDKQQLEKDLQEIYK